MNSNNDDYYEKKEEEEEAEEEEIIGYAINHRKKMKAKGKSSDADDRLTESLTKYLDLKSEKMLFEKQAAMILIPVIIIGLIIFFCFFK